MGVVDYLKQIWEEVRSPPPPERVNRKDRSHSKATASKYPIYDSEFLESITWRCTSCEQEIYKKESDSTLICHRCNTTYSLREDDFPELLRAKCWKCGEISTAVGGFRLENIWFDCPECEFEWKSSPY